ncbi:hypothetical protein GYMLUDRAFT_87500 [Collybiopsis luxurians FD-317 M1]|uniref:DUF6697 domain-containing protein n=1 Tax=Collybiopsis luxurians FD-317 M1 TaxID=944289 RepID=A0A0D0C0H6_9AGAR|nr:hypothetical protein GYMLUDRAFT_87500 [Collybiopsis luxurians FD-317 M1]
MPSSTSGRTISLPASLVEDLVRVQAGELQRLKKQLAEAQNGNSTVTSELASLIESTAKIISDLDQALTQSQEIADRASSTPRTSRSKLSTPSLISLASVIRSEGFDLLEGRSTKSEAFTNASYSRDASDAGKDEESEANSLHSSSRSEMSSMESIATQSLSPFTFKPWPQQHINALKQLGTLRQPTFYPGDELIIDFANRRQAYLITVMYTTNNAQRTRKLHAWFEEFALKGWSGALMVRHERAWYYIGTYKTIGYAEMSREEFEALSDKTKGPVIVQAAHAVQVPKIRTAVSGKSKKDSGTSGSSGKSGVKKTANPSSSSSGGSKKASNNHASATTEVSSSIIPSKTEVQARIADGRIELAKVTFGLVSFDEELAKTLIDLNL